MSRPVAVRTWAPGTGLAVTRPVAVRSWAPGTGPSCPQHEDPENEKAWIKVSSCEQVQNAEENVPEQDDDDDEISEEYGCRFRNPYVKVGNVKIKYKRKTSPSVNSPEPQKKPRPSPVIREPTYKNKIHREEFSRGKSSGASSSRLAGRPSSSREIQADDRASVLTTLKIYEQLRRHVMRQETLAGKSSGKAHLTAMKMVKQRTVTQSSTVIGNIPGVEVGDIFYYRSVMNLVGLHGPIQGGIGTIKKNLNQFGVAVANSIVLSGGYEDDYDQGETFVYTGAGGNNYKGDKKQCTDQELQRGNKALVNSYTLEVPIRVIRGCTDKGSPTSKTYSYDGLYKVQRHWADIGKSGHKVYKFQMRRCSDQPPLASSLVTFSGAFERKKKSQLLGDITCGLEAEPINVVNEVNKCPAPSGFTYRSRMDYSRCNLSGASPGCDCRIACRVKCGCIAHNGGVTPYTSESTLVSTRSIVYECSPRCSCPTNCITRVSQVGISRKLQVFRTEDKGWGLRSWQTIPSGSFVCEIVGDVVTTKNRVSASGHLLFDIDCINKSEDQLLDISSYFDDLPEIVPDINPEKSGHFLDASKTGNVSRFINHSCCPNLLVQCVLYDHMDTKLPHLMLFAMENIKPFQELTFNYATVMELDDASTPCHCGERICRKWI